MDGWELRAERRRNGLTLRAVARAAGTSEPNLSAYERGAKRPNARTLARIQAVVAVGSESVIHQRHLVTVPAAAAALRSGLRAGWPTPDLLRIVRELRSNATFAVEPADVTAFFAEPSTTGDQRWDALLAGCVEDLALRRATAPPVWCRGHALAHFWFVGSSPSLQAYTFARSPFPMQVRGVMIDPTDLESV